MKKKGITLSEIKQVAAEAISHFNINKYIGSFSDQELISLCDNADPDIFTDISISDNVIVRQNLRWDKVRPKRLSRMMARAIDLGFIDLLNQIDTKVMKIKVYDLRFLLGRKPEMIERFNIDLKTITNTEAHMLLELGKEYFLERIDIKGRQFSTSQQFGICKAYNYSRHVMLLFNCKLFDGFQTKEIIKTSGHDNVDLLNIKNMKLLDWLDLLSFRPDTYQYCEPDMFKNDLVSLLISLAVVSDDDRVYSIIKGKDLDEVSPFGWERLMSHRPLMFESVCDYKKLDALNKRNVIAMNPHLVDLMKERGVT